MQTTATTISGTAGSCHPQGKAEARVAFDLALHHYLISVFPCALRSTILLLKTMKWKQETSGECAYVLTL